MYLFQAKQSFLDPIKFLVLTLPTYIVYFFPKYLNFRFKEWCFRRTMYQHSQQLQFSIYIYYLYLR